MPGTPTVPECPVGWATGPPDFVGIGFQRCGTTRWWNLLSAHPDIHRPERKELHFFDRLQGCEPSAEIEIAYHRQFPRPPGALCGEWTPRYALDHGTPPLLRAAAPKALLLVAVRDPIERFISGLAHTERLGIRSDDNAAAALFRGMYLPQLRHLLRHVDRKKLVLLQFEKSLIDPIGEIQRTYAALGVDCEFAPESPRTPVNERKVSGEITTFERHELISWLEEEVLALAMEFPEIDLGLWPNFAHLAR